MSWLVALVAFAGIMGVFSTVVTVAVEAYHKALSLRRSGLQEMLRAMHMQVVSRLDKALPEDDQRALIKASSQFAKSMTKSPAYGGHGRWWWPANWGLNISQRRFERLSKRQLAEQLAQTDFGKRLVMADRLTIQGVMAEMAYEFDRIGAAQSDYFRRRAKVISGVIAFAFVAIGNINAIEIYKHVAKNEASAGRAIEFVEKLGSEQAILEQAKSEVSSNTENATVDTYLLAVERVQVKAELPIGRAYFPFCEGMVLPGTEGRQNVDPELCPAPDKVYEMWVFDKSNKLLVPAVVGNAVERPWVWIVWLVSIITTAGLLGLGAPFWFDVFNKASALAGRQVTQAKAAAAEEEKKSQPSKSGLRGGEDADAEEMAEALLIASGQAHRCRSTGAGAPMGLRLGPASADQLKGTPAAPSNAPPQSIRLAPGVVKGSRK